MTGTLKFKQFGLQYEVPISGKYTIIQGDSSVGKTKSLWMYKQTEIVKGVAIADITSVALLCESAQCSVILMDEDAVNAITHEIANAMNKSDKQFVLFVRRIPKMLSVDYRDIYDMHESGKYHICKRKYPDYDKFISSNSYLCEDKKSGYLYMCSHFDNVRSAEGKDKIPFAVNPGDTVFADGAAIGAAMDFLYRHTLRYANTHLYLPISFEYLICKQLDKNLNEDIAWWEKYHSSEVYYTHKCIELCARYGIAYSKSFLNDKIKNMRLFTIESNSLEERVRSLSIDGAESVISYLPEAASGFSDAELEELVKSLLD